MPREIRLNAFDMACIGHIQHGMWTHPRDRSADYTGLDYWTGLARTLERGLFDGLFLADVLGVYDVYRGSPDAAAHSDDVGRAFRLMSATGSDRSRPAVPIDVGRGGAAPVG